MQLAMTSKQAKSHTVTCMVDVATIVKVGVKCYQSTQSTLEHLLLLARLHAFRASVPARPHALERVLPFSIVSPTLWS